MSAILKTGVVALFLPALATLATAGIAQAAPFTLTSSAFKNSGAIPDKYSFNGMGCTGENVAPPLEWKNPPAGTKSFALMVHDPDAPTGSGFWHWVIFNIPATVTELPKNAGNLKANLAPPGSVQSRTDFGVAGYNGPCPPAGDKPHRYRISVFAVDVPHLDGDQNTPAAVIGFELHFHTIAKGVLISRFGREK